MVAAMRYSDDVYSDGVATTFGPAGIAELETAVNAVYTVPLVCGAGHV